MNDLSKPTAQLHPIDLVLLTFIYLQQTPGVEVSVTQQGLIKCMLMANCPSKETAEKVLAQMVKAGLLVEQTGDRTVFYTRTQLGIANTPPVPKKPVKH